FSRDWSSDVCSSDLKLAAIGVPERERKMRVAQLWHWIYFRGARDFSEMTNVGKGLRAALAESFSLARPEVVSEQVSKDGTRKWRSEERRVGKERRVY